MKPKVGSPKASPKSPLPFELPKGVKLRPLPPPNDPFEIQPTGRGHDGQGCTICILGQYPCSEFIADLRHHAYGTPTTDRLAAAAAKDLRDAWAGAVARIRKELGPDFGLGLISTVEGPLLVVETMRE